MERLPAGTQLAYAAIPHMNVLPEALRIQVRSAFADSMRAVWYVMLAVSALGLISTALMREVAMMNRLDATWGLQDEKMNQRDTRDTEVVVNRSDTYELFECEPGRPQV